METNLGNLQSRVMTVTLEISLWNRFCNDRSANAVVDSAFHTQRSAGHFRKERIPDARKLASSAQLIRSWFYANTVPWGDNGTRLLPVEKFMDFGAGFVQQQGKFDAVLSELLDQWDTLREVDKVSLGDLYHEGNYPTAAELRKQCSVHIRYGQLADTEDIRIKADDTAITAVRESMRLDYQERIEAAESSLCARVLDTVKHLGEMLGKTEKTRLHKSLLDNISGVCDAMSTLNVTESPAVTGLVDQVRNAFAMVSIESLRENDAERERVRTIAEALAKGEPVPLIPMLTQMEIAAEEIEPVMVAIEEQVAPVVEESVTPVDNTALQAQLEMLNY